MNRILQANDALFAVVEAAFPTVTVERNPKGGVPTPARDATGLGFAVAYIDDREPEVKGFLLGPIYELVMKPCIIFAYRGDVDERQVRQIGDLERLKAVLDRREGGDPKLGGVVEWAEMLAPAEADLDRAKWLAGGLEVIVELQFFAPSKAG